MRRCALSVIFVISAFAGQAAAAPILFDFGNGSIQSGWYPVTDGGATGSGNNGAGVSITVTAVGSVTVDNRTRSDNGGGTESDMWADFLFANGSNLSSEGFDIAITGLNADTTYPVRIWAFDDSSNGGRSTNWDGFLLTFPDSPDPVDLDDYVVSFNITTDGSGAVTIQGRAADTDVHNVFINGMEIGNPIPEPTTIGLFTLGLFGLTGYGRRRKR